MPGFGADGSEDWGAWSVGAEPRTEKGLVHCVGGGAQSFLDVSMTRAD
jgi:hypothetical protein